jgi:hypothetical protein
VSWRVGGCSNISSRQRVCTEDAKGHPKSKKDNSWEKAIAAVQPLVEEEQQRLMQQLSEVRKTEKCAPCRLLVH